MTAQNAAQAMISAQAHNARRLLRGLAIWFCKASSRFTTENLGCIFVSPQ